jgi:hypothetical protein
MSTVKPRTTRRMEQQDTGHWLNVMGTLNTLQLGPEYHPAIH